MQVSSENRNKEREREKRERDKKVTEREREKRERENVYACVVRHSKAYFSCSFNNRLHMSSKRNCVRFARPAAKLVLLGPVYYTLVSVTTYYAKGWVSHSLCLLGLKNRQLITLGRHFLSTYYFSHSMKQNQKRVEQETEVSNSETVVCLTLFGAELLS